MINGDRVRQAREIRAWTQAELATHIGATQPTVSDIESGRIQGSRDTIERIALSMGFPVVFFQQGAPSSFPLGSLLFRARAALASNDRARTHRHAQLVFEFAERMAEHANIPNIRIPEHTDDPGAAATLTRATVGLPPEAPIPHLLDVLERSGVIVILLPPDIGHVDAFSAWAGTERRRPVIAVSQGKSGDRMRFSVAHELGHLVMHQAPKGSFERLEYEANQFAAEFLMPEVAMRQEITAPIALPTLLVLKTRWGVSVQALIKRARDLNIITERQQRYLFQRMAARGWRTEEPKRFAVPTERPRLLRKMAEVLYGTRIDYDKLAADMRLSTSFVRSVIEAYAEKPGSQGEALKLRHPPSHSSKVIPIHGTERERSGR